MKIVECWRRTPSGKKRKKKRKKCEEKLFVVVGIAILPLPLLGKFEPRVDFIPLHKLYNFVFDPFVSRDFHTIFMAMGKTVCLPNE